MEKSDQRLEVDDGIRQVGRVSTESVKKCTGKSWSEWKLILDRAGGPELSHQELVSLLKTKFRQSLWWQQIVASGYEKIIGRRKEGENAKGFYSTTLTKNLPVSAAEVWKKIISKQGISLWLAPLEPLKLEPGSVFELDGGSLGPIYGQIRQYYPKKRIRTLRMSWRKDTDLLPSYFHISLVPRGAKKMILVFSHDQLASAELKLKIREFWKARLEKFISSACLLKSTKKPKRQMGS